MALESRNGKGSYYYHSKRVNGRVVKEYFGCGPDAEMVAELHEATKQKRKINSERLNAAKVKFKLLDRQMDQLQRAPIHALRSERALEGKEEANSPPVLPTPESVVSRAKELFRARESGDEKAEAELIDLIDRFPVLLHRIGDLAGRVRAKWITLIVGKDEVFRKATIKNLEHLRSKFPEDESPTSRLLVERILATWLQVTFFEGKMAEVPSRDFKAFEFFSRQQKKAQKQHLQAIRSWVYHHETRPQEV